MINKESARKAYSKFKSFKFQLFIFRLWLICFDFVISTALTLRVMDYGLDERLGYSYWSLGIGYFLIFLVGILSFTSVLKKIGNAVGCK